MTRFRLFALYILALVRSHVGTSLTEKNGSFAVHPKKNVALQCCQCQFWLG